MTDLADRLTKAHRDQSFPNQRPRDGHAILIDRPGPPPRS